MQLPYTIEDSNGATDTGTVTFLIFDPAPVAVNDIHITEMNTAVVGDVLLNDSDANPADTLTIVEPSTGTAATTAVTITTNGGGTVVINPDGTYQYTPANGFTGEDTFDYTIIDTFGKTDLATVSIEVRDLNGPIDPPDPAEIDNTPPIATDDSFSVTADVPLSSSVMSNDTDPDGDVITIAELANTANGEPATGAQTITTNAGGTVALNTDGTFTYTPAAGFIGEDSFDYVIVDPSGATDAASVTLTVTPDDLSLIHI